MIRRSVNDYCGAELAFLLNALPWIRDCLLVSRELLSVHVVAIEAYPNLRSLKLLMRVVPPASVVVDYCVTHGTSWHVVSPYMSSLLYSLFLFYKLDTISIVSFPHEIRRDMVQVYDHACNTIYRMDI